MKTKPTITLKGIKCLERSSDETPCYEATLCVDGEPLAVVRNGGHGGCDQYDHLGDVSRWRWTQDAVARLDKRIAETYPAKTWGNMVLPESLEGLCHGIVWRHMETQKIKRKMARKVLIRRDGNVYELKGPRSDALIAAAVAKYGADNVLNLLPPDEAVALVPAV